MNIHKLLLTTALFTLPFFVNAEKSTLLESAVVSKKKAKTQHFAWGTLITYFNSETFGTKDGLNAVAIMKPGQEIHPPHDHSDEEYLMVLSGNGTWTLNGKDFPAKTGDMLYAKPWDMHGLKNTGDKPLKFVVFKWNSKAVLPASK